MKELRILICDDTVNLISIPQNLRCLHDLKDYFWYKNLGGTIFQRYPRRMNWHFWIGRALNLHMAFGEALRDWRSSRPWNWNSNWTKIFWTFFGEGENVYQTLTNCICYEIFLYKNSMERPYPALVQSITTCDTWTFIFVDHYILALVWVTNLLWRNFLFAIVRSLKSCPTSWI